MSWDQVASNSFVNQQRDTIEQNLQALPYYQQLASRGISSGGTEIGKAKTAIDTALGNIRAETNSRRSMMQGITNANQQSDVSSLTSHIDALKPRVEQQNTIFQLRTEQASALANKYASNWHSNWMLWFPVGLAKPLSNTTRVLLYVGAAGLLVAATVAATVARTTTTAAESKTVPTQEGGRRKNRTVG